MTICADDFIPRIEEKIADAVGPQRFGVWFKNATQFSLTDEFLCIATPNHFVGEWIQRHFSDAIVSAARDVTGRDLTLSFVTDPVLAKSLGRKQPDRQVDFVAGNPERVAREQRRFGSSAPPQTLRGKLGEFVVGTSNQLAFSAAESVIDSPAGDYNPLFLHGGCGVGKTHLAQAICLGIAERKPELRWRYVSGEEFTNDYVLAVRSREMNAFHNRYRTLDVLVIDDVHFLANKRATQEEFLHTVKAIDRTGKQIVLTSDTHPKLIGHFSEPLISRFLSGMVVRIESPDLEVRRGVLRQKADKLKADVPDEVIDHIAEAFVTNGRELEGALLKVVALGQLHGRAITVGLAQQCLKDLVRQTAPVVMLADIESVVAIYFGLAPTDLHTSRKSRTIALARGIAMHLARKHTDMSFPEIGRFMGNKNHSTVILANRRIGKQVTGDEVVSWTTPEGMREQRIVTIVEQLEGELFREGRPVAPNAPHASATTTANVPQRTAPAAPVPPGDDSSGDVQQHAVA